MLKLSIIALLVGLGILIWLVASRLSSDAIGMALGVIFGLLAGLPAALLAAASHRRESFSRWDDYRKGYQAGQRDLLTNSAQYQVGESTVIDARPIVQRQTETGWRP